MMQRNNHRGKSWNDLHLNDMICAQTQAWANKQESMDLPEWMREMCHRGSDPEVKMVTGERYKPTIRRATRRVGSVVGRGSGLWSSSRVEEGMY